MAESIEDAEQLIAMVDRRRPLSKETLDYLKWLCREGPDWTEHSFSHERRALIKAGLGHYSDGCFRPTPAGVERAKRPAGGVELAGQEDAA